MTELSPYLPGILLAWSILVIGICSPGPAVLAIIGTSMATGRRQGLALGLGVVCGSVFWGILSAAGLSALLTGYATALIVIKIIGGLYLLWLAFKAFRAAMASDAATGPQAIAERPRLGQYYMSGLIIHLTNPKAIFAWLATISLGLDPSAPVWVAFAIVAGGAVISFVGNLGYALFFSTPLMSALYARARRYIQFGFAAVFAAAGVTMLTSR